MAIADRVTIAVGGESLRGGSSSYVEQDPSRAEQVTITEFSNPNADGNTCKAKFRGLEVSGKSIEEVGNAIRAAAAIDQVDAEPEQLKSFMERMGVKVETSKGEAGQEKAAEPAKRRPFPMR